jgi:hypothetical protein
MSLRRILYNAGRVLSLDDLRAEQAYHRARVQRLARVAIGAGIVSGLEVRCGRREITVMPGSAIDCLGEVVEVSEATSLPLPPHSRERCWVMLTYQETVGESASVPSDGENATVEPGWVEEWAALSIDWSDPMRGHRRARHRYIACGTSHGVPLARLVVRSGQWRTDPAWRPTRG